MSDKVIKFLIDGGTGKSTTVPVKAVDNGDGTYSFAASIQDPLETNGAIPINIQDQHTEIIDLYTHRNTGTLSLVVNSTIGAVVLSLGTGHGSTAGDTICLKENGRYTQASALGFAGDDVTIDTPLDFAYTVAADVHKGDHDMAVDGSAVTQEFHIAPPAGVEWDIVRIMFHIEDSTLMDDGKFGGGSALTNGIVLQVRNGITKNIFNVKTNGEFAERAHDRTYVSKPPAGTGHAMNVRRTFGGQNKNGVTIRLGGDDADELVIMIQDNLLFLDHFHAVVQGHVVTD